MTSVAIPAPEERQDTTGPPITAGSTPSGFEGRFEATNAVAAFDTPTPGSEVGSATA